MSTPAAQVPAGRIAQLRQAYRMTKQTQPKIGLLLLGVFVLTAAATGAFGYFVFGTRWYFIILTVLLALTTALLVTMIVFGRRAEKSMYAQAEGQLGAGAGALQMLKRGWDVKPAVGFTKQQDVVHRVVGRPGLVLVGEGTYSRVKNLLSAEVTKHQRIVGDDVPVTSIIVGRGEDEVPLPKLVKHVRKLPKAIKPAQQTEVLYKLKALDAMRPAAPMPRGPVPTSMKGARKAMRG